jgi:hypothetical protein
MLARATIGPKFIMIGEEVVASNMGEVVDWCFVVQAADPERSSPIYYTSIDAVSVKDVPLGSHPPYNGDFQP